MKFLVSLFLIFPLGLFLQGTVLIKGWSWFILPLGAPDISFFHSLGLSSIIAYFAMLSTSKDVDEDPDEKLFRVSATVIVAPLVTLLFMWIFKSFM